MDEFIIRPNTDPTGIPRGVPGFRPGEPQFVSVSADEWKRVCARWGVDPAAPINFVVGPAFHVSPPGDDGDPPHVVPAGPEAP